MKSALEQIEIPGAAEAEERAARVVVAAFGEPRAARLPRRGRGPLIAVAVAAALVAAVLSPPGRAFVDHVRHAVGIDHARSALFSLPTGGRLLVASDSGVWIASADGSRRLLGRYDEASWSPLGRYVVAAKDDELAALASDGSVRWTLARSSVHFPRWTGTATDTRIAYLSGSRLHVVAGDGTHDADVAPAAAQVAPAWGSGFGFVLAYADTRARISAVLTAKGASLWRSAPLQMPRSLEWSSDGTELLVLSQGALSILRTNDGHVLSNRRAPATAAAAFRPGTHAVAEIEHRGAVSDVKLGGRTLFSSAGELRGLTWSPDGRWLLVGSPEADQWVFIRADRPRIVAVSNIMTQFRSRSFPRIQGWCCSK